MEAFEPYGAALAWTGAVALLALLISPITALLKMTQGLPAGANPTPDYRDPVYRLNRSYLNMTENMGIFAVALAAAVLAGADPWWVNTMAAVFFFSRVVHLLVHAGGIGPMNFGPRTIAFVVGWAATGILAVLAIISAM